MEKEAVVDEETLKLEIQGNYEYAPGIIEISKRKCAWALALVNRIM